jgi:GNAT superfamily N-acetyltransferase
MEPKDLKQGMQRLYDLHMRQRSWIPGFTRHDEADITRYRSWSGERNFVMWHRFGVEVDLGARVTDELAWFKSRGAKSLYWKVYAHDEPSELVQALLDAGAEREDESLLHMVSVAAVLQGTRMPSALAVHASSQSELLPRATAVWNEVWPDSAEENVQFSEVYAKALDDSAARGEVPGVCFFTATEAHVAPAEAGTALGAAYIIHPPQSPVALLCGGAVREAARGRGVYGALLRARAEWAQARGIEHLAIEASPMSQPIVQKLGFTPLVEMAFYKWTAL